MRRKRVDDGSEHMFEPSRTVAAALSVGCAWRWCCTAEAFAESAADCTIRWRSCKRVTRPRYMASTPAAMHMMQQNDDRLDESNLLVCPTNLSGGANLARQSRDPAPGLATRTGLPYYPEDCCAILASTSCP